MQATDSLSHPDHNPEHDQPRPEASRRDLLGWLKTALLIGLGLYFIHIIASGSLTNYINANFAWLSYVAVALFLLLGLASALELLRPRGGHDHHDHDHDHDHEHEHALISWRTLAVVAIPLVLGTLVPSRPLGSAAVNGNISVNAAGGGGFTAFSSDPLTWNVLDWLRAFHNSDDISRFNGQRADVIGFVYREITFPEDQFMVARFTISCCVADASAIGLPVVWATGAEIPADTWVRVQGEFQVGDFRGDTVPILHARQVAVISQPEHPYLYP